MSNRFLRTVTLAALAACCTLALAETPTRVGRIAVSQGQVGISGEQGEQTNAALVNWPVTSRNQVTTGRDGRTEIRIGSTAVRLDADSALDITELEDDTLRVHLHYGSANIRVRNADVLSGFDLTTPQGNVRLLEVGQIRVDAGRRRDITEVSVFQGVAQVDGGGSRLTVRAGKRAEIGQDDVRTGLAMRDSFDEWALQRDLRDDRSESVRYVSNEMTGYEDLDQNGIWREHQEYGPLWSPRNVSYGWAPYRDGRWTYLQPWGWTWVDNAPWGYAPFHYGRWVMVDQRWCWAPGRNISRVIWSPALVGWVGGNNWNANFGSGHARRTATATGWYPLAPRDKYVPNYRMNHDNLRYLNRQSGSAQPDIRVRASQRRDGQQHAGLTVVPHEQFRQRGTVVVPTSPRGTVSPAQFFTSGATQGVPPVPQTAQRERGGNWRRIERSDQAAGARNVPAPFPDQMQSSQPAGPDARRVSGFGSEPRRQRQEPQVQVQQVQQVPQVPATAAPAAAVFPGLQSQPEMRQSGREERSRFKRNELDPDAHVDVERERRPRGAESFQQQQMRQHQMQQQQAQQQQLQQQQMQQQQAQQQQAQHQMRMQQMQQAQQQRQIQQQAQQQAQQQQQQQQQQQIQQMQQQQAQVQQPRPQQERQSEPVNRRATDEGAREKTRRAREDANDMR